MAENIINKLGSAHPLDFVQANDELWLLRLTDGPEFSYKMVDATFY